MVEHKDPDTITRPSKELANVRVVCTPDMAGIIVRFSTICSVDCHTFGLIGLEPCTEEAFEVSRTVVSLIVISRHDDKRNRDTFDSLVEGFILLYEAV